MKAATARRKRPSKPQKEFMPQHGHVQGGRFHGYAFTFLGVLHDPTMWGGILFDFIVGEPGWPFPKRLVMGDGRGDFDRLIGEEKTKRIELQPLYDALLEREPLPPLEALS